MQSGAGRQEQPPIASHPVQQGSDPMLAELAMDLDPQARQAEELGMLLIGFVTGLGIAGIFLIYIVLEAARLLP